MKLFESFSGWLSNADLSGEFDLSSLLPPFAAEKLRSWGEEYPMVASMAEQARDWFATHAVTVFRKVLGSTLTVAYYLAVIVVSCFFLIRDGSLIIGYLKDILPFARKSGTLFSAGRRRSFRRWSTASSSRPLFRVFSERRAGGMQASTAPCFSVP